MKTETQNRPRNAAGREVAGPRRVRGGALTLRKILVPLDFSGKSREALDFALPLARQYGGKIFLLHVAEPVLAHPPYPASLGTTEVKPHPLAAQSRERLAALAEERIPRQYFGSSLLRVGRPYQEIIAIAALLEADLIVIATHGYTGLKHVLLGSTAERVVRDAPCSVLTVRRHSLQPEDGS